MFKSTYEVMTKGDPTWNELQVPCGTIYEWDPASTHINKPPFADGMIMCPPGFHGVRNAHCLLFLGDSMTTDHISPPGNIHKDSSATRFLTELSIDRRDYNSYGSRRGNNKAMARGTFANTQIVNKLVDGEVGPVKIHIAGGEKMSGFDAAMVSLHFSGPYVCKQSQFFEQFSDLLCYVFGLTAI